MRSSNASIKLLEKIIRTFDVSNIVNNNPWSGILAAIMFAIRATYHTTLQASPMQLVFVQDAILNIKHVADWEHIRQRKQHDIANSQTMMDPATGWFDMAQIPNKAAAEIADITEKTWFTRYPLPQRIVFDRGT